jgi:hypothetical protein
MLMTVLVGAAVLIIIAAVVFLIALGVLRRQVRQEPEVTGTPVREVMPVVPAQEFLADHLGATHSLTYNEGQRSNASDSRTLNGEGQWGRAADHFGPDHDNLVSRDVMTFATEPVRTELLPPVSAPNAMQLPSTPMPHQQAIPLTPVDLLEVLAGEVVTDPVLEAMMLQAQAGLYVIPEREDKQ